MRNGNGWPTLVLPLVAASVAWAWVRAAWASPEEPPVTREPQRVRSKDGTPIAYERSGSGPVVILVSGALSSRADSARLAEVLAPTMTVVRYDRRGRGDSGDTKPYAVEREVEDLEALIVEVGGSASLFGTSSGAVLALEAAQRLGKRVKRLALFEPPFLVDDSRPPIPKDFPATVARLVADGRRSDAVTYFLTEVVGQPAATVAAMKRTPAWPALERLAHTLEYDGRVVGDAQQGKPLSRTRWAAVAVPALVLYGGESPPFLRDAARALVEILPGARLEALAGQDHSAPSVAPEAFRPLLGKFFAGDGAPVSGDRKGSPGGAGR